MQSADRIIAEADAAPRAATPPAEPRFHHVQINVVDPESSAAFFTAAFPTARPTSIAGRTAVCAEDTLLLFNRVAVAAPHEWNTGLWHIGWQTPDVPAEFERLSAQGVRFYRPPPPPEKPWSSAHFVTPDNLGVELARGESLRFDHIHLMSEAPLATADWYVSVLGLRRGPEVGRSGGSTEAPFSQRAEPANQIHSPNARLYAGDILLFVYPNQDLLAFTSTPAAGHTQLVSTAGHVLDHIGFRVADLDGEEARLRALGVAILQPPEPFGDAGARSMMIQGPDLVRIALVDGP